ncbi:MAG: NYN domain-containing protein [Anaerovoracaceae bacterium]
MRALWLIDGSYIYKAGKSFQNENPKYKKNGLDYKKLKDCLRKEFNIETLDSWYFNSTPDPATDSQNAYHSWLKTTEPKGPNIRVKLYDLKEKTIECKNCGKTFSIKVQKGVDVGIATTALRLFERYDALILSAGDGDFEDFIRYIVEDNDKLLYIVGFDKSISPDLQQFSTANYLLNEHYDKICDDREVKPFDTVDEVVSD